MQNSKLKIPDQSIVTKALNDVCCPENYLRRMDNRSFLGYYGKFSGSFTQIYFISFNYTSSIGDVLKWENGKTLENSNNRLPGYIKMKEILYVHHKAIEGDCVLVGVDNVQQIKNPDFRENTQLIEHMVKPIANKMMKNGEDYDCKDLIGKTDLFIIFGSSLGETDKTWWNEIANRLRTYTNARLLIYVKDEKLSGGRDLAEEERQIKNNFLSNVDHVNAEEKDKLSNQIYVAINSGMFGCLSDICK